MSDDSLPERIRPNAEATIMGISRFMRRLNDRGLPVMSVSAGFSENGLPIGPQLIGGPFGVELPTALGQAFPTATDDHKRMPKLP